MATRILLLRHGQSVANTEKYFSGHIDVELTELGLKQAELAAETLKSEHFDIILSSPLKRAVETALPFAKDRDLTVFVDENLIEWNAGEWEGLDFNSIKEKFPVEYRCWSTCISKLHMPNGESACEVRERFGKALNSIAQKHKDKTVLIACHGGVIMTAPSYFAGCDDTVLDSTKVPNNCSITEIVYENGEGKVVRYSDDSHLGSCKNEAFVI